MMIIYMITNIVNGKYYIGQTKRSLQRRWVQHIWGSNKKPKTYFLKAIKKHGSENFKREILCECPDQDSLNRAEQFLVWSFASNKPSIGYNLVPGGKQGSAPRTESWRKAIGDALRSRKRPNLVGKPKIHSPEAIRKRQEKRNDRIEEMEGLNNTEHFIGLSFIVSWAGCQGIPLKNRTFLEQIEAVNFARKNNDKVSVRIEHVTVLTRISKIDKQNWDILT